MTKVNKNDVNQIFASNAPDQDKPPSFNNYTNGWGESRTNNGKPTIKQQNFIQQRTDQNLLWIHQNGGALPYDASIEYVDGAVTLKDGRISKLVDSVWIDVLKSENPTALSPYYDSSVTYQVGSRIMLDDNSGFVVSTIANNSNNPNTNLVGWNNLPDLSIINAVNGLSDLESLSAWNGRCAYVKNNDGLFEYQSGNDNKNNLGIYFNNWVRIGIEKVTPKMFGIKQGDNTTDYSKNFNYLFNCGYPVYIPSGSYYSSSPIVVYNKNLVVFGDSRSDSNLIFTVSGDGLIQKTLTGTHTFSIKDIALLTTQAGSKNGSGFRYDASEYIATLAITSTGYKQLANRSLTRGVISELELGNVEKEENSNGWGVALEFIGAMNYSVKGLYMRLPIDASGDGVWIHGDGMMTDMHFNDVYSFWGNRVFRMNDYLEGFHLHDFEFVNCNEGISVIGDSQTTVQAPVKILAAYIGDGHIFAYTNAISTNIISSGKLHDLELYLYAKTASSVVQAITAVTLDSLLVHDVAIIKVNNQGTSFGLQLGAGWGNSADNVTIKGENFTYGMALGTAGAFYGNDVKGVKIENATIGININDSNCYNNNIEVPTSISNVANPITLSDSTIRKNNVKFKVFQYNSSLSFTSNTNISIDISDSKCKTTPLNIQVQEIGATNGGLSYTYRKDASSPTSVSIDVKSSVSTPDPNTRALLVTIIGY